MPDPLSAIDKIIAEAQEDGRFNDLPGKGKPLTIDPSPDAVVKGILKEANVSVAPEWMTLANEIDALLEQMDRGLEAYRAEAAADRAELTGAGSAEARTTETSPTSRSSEPRWRHWWRAFAAGSANAGASATAAALRRDQAMAAFHRRWDDTLAQYAARLHECNRKIRRFNQLVPLVNHQRRLLPVQERLEVFAERFPRLARAGDGSLHPVRGVVPAALFEPPAVDNGPAARQRDVVEAVALQRMRQLGRKPPPIG